MVENRLWAPAVRVCGSKPRAVPMGPRRKSSKVQLLGSNTGGTVSSSPSESKDYINELSHEVLCHVFRYLNRTNFLFKQELHGFK